jgi:hypothetical protein
LLDQLTSVQLSEWEAYDVIDPIGTWREDFRFAYLMSMIQNIVNALYSKKGSATEASKPNDFMIDWTGDKKQNKNKMSMEQMKKAILSIARDQTRKVKLSKLGINKEPVLKTKKR